MKMIINAITLFIAVIAIGSNTACEKVGLHVVNKDTEEPERMEELPGSEIGSTGWVKYFEGTDTITYITVRAEDNQVWLQQNLGSHQVATSATDTSAYGYLYQWGRWNDGHQYRNPTNLQAGMPPANPLDLTTSSVNPFFYNASPQTWWGNGVISDQWLAEDVNAVSATNGCDPCRALGDGWRLPYNSEWKRVVDRENIGNMEDAFLSNLKLVAGGHLNGVNGAFFRVNTRGYYWSSTASSSGKAIATHFWESTVLPSNPDIRGNGFSVRCIKASDITESSVPGVIIAHTPAYKRIFIGSPSIIKLTNGDLIASNDFFGPNSEARPNGQSFTRIYRSTDQGASWSIVTDLSGQFMSTLFLHQDVLYIMGVSGGYSNGNHVVIRKSLDNGNSWSNPTTNTAGKLLDGKYHTAPTPVITHSGRIWRTMEDAYGPSNIFAKQYRALMMSAPVDSDLLDSLSWTVSNPMAYDTTYMHGYFWGWLEGNAVVSPSGQMLNILRVHTFSQNREQAALVEVSNDGTLATFDASTGFVDMPGSMKKFTIRYDATSGRYWTLANYVPNEYHNIRPLDKIRNTLALCSSADLRSWSVDSTVIHHPDIDLHGYQYVDWQFDGNDIIAVSRTSHDDGVGGAANHHDANYLTFHRITDFRETR